MPESFNWDQITKIMGSRHHLPPAGSISVPEFAARQGMGASTARASLSRLVACGVLERGRFFNKATGCWVNYYWSKKPEKRK